MNFTTEHFYFKTDPEIDLVEVYATGQYTRAESPVFYGENAHDGSDAEIEFILYDAETDEVINTDDWDASRLEELRQRIFDAMVIDDPNDEYYNEEY